MSGFSSQQWQGVHREVESEEPEAKLQSVAKAEAKANQSAKIRVRLGTMTRKINTHYPNVDKKVCVGGMEGKELRQPGEILHSPCDGVHGLTALIGQGDRKSRRVRLGIRRRNPSRSCTRSRSE